MRKWRAGRLQRSAASQRRKRDIFSNMGRDLTPSELELLKADIKRGNQELDRLLANDPLRVRKTPLTT